MNLLREYKPAEGYVEIFKRGESGLKLVTFGILSLSDGKSFAGDSGDEEVALIVMSGKCTVKVGSTTYQSIGKRTSVFGGRAYGVYIPCGKSYEVTGEGQVDIAVCKAPSDLKSDPVLITPDDVLVKTVGQHNWKRYVHDIVDMRVKAGCLVIGETFNPPGNWSSSPPHRHDFDNIPDESEQEEVYFFKVSPPQGFAVQRIYTDDLSLDELYAIKDGDTVAIPEGYHPVAAAPGYQVYYLWILAGEKRILCPKDDPAHTWLKACEPIIKEV